MYTWHDLTVWYWTCWNENFQLIEDKWAPPKHAYLVYFINMSWYSTFSSLQLKLFTLETFHWHNSWTCFYWLVSKILTQSYSCKRDVGVACNRTISIQLGFSKEIQVYNDFFNLWLVYFHCVMCSLNFILMS